MAAGDQQLAPPSGKAASARDTVIHLPQLQNLIKRDPVSYREDFLRQFRHFQSNLDILRLNPAHDVKHFGDLVLFLSHVSQCYPEDMRAFGPQLMDLLREHYAILTQETRGSLVRALMLLRSKKQLDQIQLLSLLFFLFRCRDKQLRATLQTFIKSDIRSANLKGKNNKLNKVLQNFMFGMINGDAVGAGTAGATGQLQAHAGTSGDASDIAALYSLQICIELYRKHVWDDTKTVNIVATALQSPHVKVVVAALKFFLGADREEPEDESDKDEDVPDLNSLQYRASITKKSRSQKTKLERAMKTIKRKEKSSSRAESFNFSALHLLNDPQSVAEKLLRRVTKNGGKGGVASSRELKFDLVSRLIGTHKLTILEFYTNITRFLKPHQEDVTQILAVCAQATHDLVPPDAVEVVIRTIMDNFVTDAYASEVITVGMNAIRQICSRCPLAMDEEVLSYLVTFKTHRDKGVIIAARSLIALFREINPELLPKRERGKTASMELAAGEKKKPVYGATAVAKGVDGTQFLVGKVLEEVDDGAWEIDENGDSDDAEEGWVTIPSGDTRTHIELSETDSSSDNDEDEEEEAADEDEESDGDEAEESDDEEVVESDDDAPELADAPVDESAGAAPVLPIEATRLLTPADFALMKKLRQEAEAERMVNGPFGAHKRDRPPMTADDAEADNDEGIIDTALILGPRKKKKQDKEERLASIAEGRKDRAKFGSSRGKERGSMTNKEKSKKKNFMMMVHKRSVAGKKKMSLRDKQLKLRKHVDRQKKQKH